MPIPKHLRKFYGRTWHKVTRPLILARAKNRCEQCGAPNHTDVYRANEEGRRGWWQEVLFKPGLTGVEVRWRNERGEIVFPDTPPTTRLIRLKVGVAHLNHTPGDDRPENLKALCDWCHLHFDAGKHHETRAARKDSARPILQAANPA